jgi:two-component sensor histidine kinase
MELALKLEHELLEKQRTEATFLYIIVVLLVLLIGAGVVFYVLLKRKNTALAILANENAFLLGESNHRIKNNLQLVVSLLDMAKSKQGDTVENTSLSQISSQINAIASLHQLLYKKKDKRVVDLPLYINEVLKEFQPILNTREVQVNTKLHAGEMAMDKAVYFGLLLVELLSNSLKHAFLEEKQAIIDVKAEVHTDAITFIYRDNGRGNVTGKTPELISIICEQLKGQCYFHSHDGFQFKTIIPK